MPGIVQRVKSFFSGRPPAGATTPGPRSKVDAASTTDENRRHWAAADALGPNATFDTLTRAKARNRGRYETLNNPYCRGMVRSLAYDLIGTGPRLQLRIPDDAGGKAAKDVERHLARWSRTAQLAQKFRLMEKGADSAGGCFGLLDTDPDLDHPVKLDLRLVEVDQCRTPADVTDLRVVDGIRVNERGKPTEYFFLKYHPGETAMIGLSGLGGSTDFVKVPARQVLHWREIDRPNQLHGLPRITASLPNFAQLRRIRLATMTAMEFAAVIAGIMKTNLPADSNGPARVEDWSAFELVRGALLSLPEGWEASQFKSEQPTTTFEMFNREVLNESGRGVGAPLNVVTGNSSGYNFSSGRLDHLPYHRGLVIDRDDFRTIVLDPIFVAWEAEARLIGLIPADLPPMEEWSWEWLWDSFDSIDPLKDAQADDIRLRNGTTTFGAVVGDAEAHFEQLAREKAYCEQLGLPWPATAGNANPPPATDETTPPAEGPDSLEAMVRMALDDAGASEPLAADVLESLAPTFAAMRVPRVNGHRRNGYPVGDRN